MAGLVRVRRRPSRLEVLYDGTLTSDVKLHGAVAGTSSWSPTTNRVGMAQTAEPVIPMLLDARSERHVVSAKPVMDC